MFAADDNANASRLAVNNERHGHSSEWSAVHDDKIPNPPRVTFRLPNYSVGFLDNQPSTGGRVGFDAWIMGGLTRKGASEVHCSRTPRKAMDRKEQGEKNSEPLKRLPHPLVDPGYVRPSPSAWRDRRLESTQASSTNVRHPAGRSRCCSLTRPVPLEVLEAAIVNVTSASCPVPLAFSTRPAPQLEDRQAVPPAVTSRLAGGPHNRRLWPVRRLARDPRRFCPRRARREVKDPDSAPTDSSRMEGFGVGASSESC
ncbi:hypothetical protein CPLU01_11811 [Colletotrichum plurivorum]|uniref:Uncharacterized protein n=1 Tax=Colletotrichum plurivorum TaxID=2175906 RepID=A0A8H6K1K5_9PEZI|nr:hypothetical protein CPLU01_11811 [Colletotrichum plurivorum]